MPSTPKSPNKGGRTVFPSPSALYGHWRNLGENTKGILWVLVATLFFALMGMVIKLLGDRLHVTQILMIRQFIMLMISAPVILRGLPGSLHTKAPMLHLLRTALASFTMVLGFTAVIELPLADSTVIGFARTFFMTIFAIILLQEAVGIHRWGATILGFIGVLVIMKPTGDTDFNIFTLMALGASCTAACVGIIVKKVTKVDQPITILTFQAASVGLVMTPFGLYYWQPLELIDVVLLAVLGLISWAAQMANIRALKHADATAIAPFDYIRLVYAAIISIIVFSEWPELSTYLGGAIIIVASFYTLHRETVRGRKIAGAAIPKDH